MAEAVRILHEKHPSLVVDGEVQANFALNEELMNEKYEREMGTELMKATSI
jgi:malate dehydrogenase (oxaloacetate-decarboxylating)(NADP+)